MGRSVQSNALIRGLIGATLMAMAAAGCTSRTLPLPPPEVKSVSLPDADGWVTVSGYALEGASVGVMNENTQEGVITGSMQDDCDNTCAWEARLHAQIGDPLRVWQFFETDGAKDVVVPKR